MSALHIDGLLLTGPHLEAARYACRVAVSARIRHGLHIPPTLAELHAQLSGDGHTDSGADTSAEDWITTSEAAHILGCTQRTIRRIAPQLDGRRTPGGWLIPRSAVTQHQEGQAA